MKKSMIFSALAGIALVLSSIPAFSQYEVKKDKDIGPIDSELKDPSRSISWNKANIKALRYFDHDYRMATNVEWSMLKDKGFLCTFKVSGIKHRAFYHPNGSWSYTTSNYQGRQLDPSIHDQIQAAYYNYRIVYVDQIDLPEHKTIYLVEIQNDKSIKKVRVSGDEMEVVREFDK